VCALNAQISKLEPDTLIFLLSAKPLLKNWIETIVDGAADMTEKMTTEQLREIAYQEILELFENDRAAAGK